MGKMKKIDHYGARRFGHLHKLIDDLTAMNDSNEFDKSFKEIYFTE